MLSVELRASIVNLIYRVSRIFHRILSHLNLPLLVLGGIGLLIIVIVTEDSEFNHLLKQISPEIGKAFLIASGLGVTVDAAIKMRLIRDAMETALGYTLPAELRDGLKWLYGMKLLCIPSTLQIKLAYCGLDDGLEVTPKYRRTLRNITNNMESLKPYTHIGEYLFSNKASEITLLRYEVDNDGWVPVLADQDEFGNRSDDDTS